MKKVVIGCKYPTGIKLEIGVPQDPAYRFVDLKGANHGEIREGGLFIPHTVCGFGRTEVDAKFWHDWSTGVGIVGEEVTDPRTGAVIKSAEVATAQLVKARKAQVDEWQATGLVFVADSPEMALAQANTHAAVQTGFEPLARDGDKRAKAAQAGDVKAA